MNELYRIILEYSSDLLIIIVFVSGFGFRVLDSVFRVPFPGPVDIGFRINIFRISD